MYICRTFPYEVVSYNIYQFFYYSKLYTIHANLHNIHTYSYCVQEDPEDEWLQDQPAAASVSRSKKNM